MKYKCKICGHIYDENEFISAVKAEYEKEIIAYHEKQQALLQEEDGIMLHLKRRFMDKKSFASDVRC